MLFPTSVVFALFYEEFPMLDEHGNPMSEDVFTKWYTQLLVQLLGRDIKNKNDIDKSRNEARHKLLEEYPILNSLPEKLYDSDGNLTSDFYIATLMVSKNFEFTESLSINIFGNLSKN